MSTVRIRVTIASSAVPVNGLVDDPEITIRNAATGAVTQAATAMTDRGADGLYTFDYTFAKTDGDTFSFLIDADPNATTQVAAADRYYDGALEVDLKEKLLENRQVLNATTGKVELYSDDDTAIEYEADVFLDEAGAQPYDGSAGVVRRDRFV